MVQLMLDDCCPEAGEFEFLGFTAEIGEDHPDVLRAFDEATQTGHRKAPLPETGLGRFEHLDAGIEEYGQRHWLEVSIAAGAAPNLDDRKTYRFVDLRRRKTDAAGVFEHIAHIDEEPSNPLAANLFRPQGAGRSTQHRMSHANDCPDPHAFDFRPRNRQGVRIRHKLAFRFAEQATSVLADPPRYQSSGRRSPGRFEIC
jgi:hypothetical protein